MIQLPEVTDETLYELRNRYAEPAIPKCSLCGGELSIQRAGGGSPTIWACSGMIDDPTGKRSWIYAEGRSMADEHYERSRWTDYRRGGDSDVINLIEAYQALHSFHHDAGRMIIPAGWKLVPVEPTQEMVDACFEATCDGGIQKGYRAMLAAAPEAPDDK